MRFVVQQQFCDWYCENSYTHSPSEGPSLEAGPQGFCHLSPVLSRQQSEQAAFAPIQTQTVVVAVYGHSSLEHLDNPSPNDQVVSQFEQQREERIDICKYREVGPILVKQQQFMTLHALLVHLIHSLQNSLQVQYYKLT